MIALVIALLLSRPVQDIPPMAESVLAAGDQRGMLTRLKKLSVPNRVQVYNFLYDKSGHPRDTRLAYGGFDDKPSRTFDYVVSDLPPGDFGRFMRYFPIIMSASRVRGFNICHARQFPALRARMRSYDLNQQQQAALGPIRFRGCSLFEPARRLRRRLISS